MLPTADALNRLFTALPMPGPSLPTNRFDSPCR
jgi:hypothetical protein